MTIFIEKKTITTPLGVRRHYFFDHVNLREYRRIVGGIAWPAGEQSGFLCVIGESDNKDVRLRRRHLWVLSEYENDGDIDKLIKRMYDVQNRYLVDPWYGDTENVLMMQFIDRFNQKLDKKKKGIYISEAPFVGEIHNLRFYANQIKSQTVTAKKSLHFGKQSQIPGQLSGLSPDDVQAKKAEDFPIAAALGYCLSGLDEAYMDKINDRELHEQLVVQRYAEGL